VIPESVTYILILIIGFISGSISGIIGAGSSIILLPILVYQYGPRQAVPIMAIAALMSNAAKLMSWWREVNWRAFAAYSISGVPAAMIGARTLLVLPISIVNFVLGLFFLIMIPTRRWISINLPHIKYFELAVAGAIVGFITGIVLSTGPLSVPIFISFGLTRGAFLSTEAASSLALMVSKVATFHELGALPISIVLQGLVIGSSVMLGSFFGKVVVKRLTNQSFDYLLDFLLLCSGVSMLWASLMPNSTFLN
jgi:uncharacterized protein